MQYTTSTPFETQIPTSPNYVKQKVPVRACVCFLHA